MNTNITAMPANNDFFNMAAASELNYREVKEKPAQENMESLRKAEEQKLMQAIKEAVTMDSTEVRDFLFMLIGATLEVKPETGSTGTNLNMMA